MISAPEYIGAKTSSLGHPAKNKSRTMRHSRPLDGIRAIAVILVMLFHFGYFAAGWIGVQVFFTLSGFLITSILLQAKGGSFALFAANFYWHRALRILPLLYFFIILSALAYTTFGAPTSFPSDWPWLVSFSANFARMRPGDLGPAFVHIWSLAVEQQFYLVWPALVYFASPRIFRIVVVVLLLATPLLRFALFQGLVSLGYGQQYAGMAAYVLPFTQFDAFAAGAAIPLWGLDRIPNAGRWFLMSAGAAAVAGLGVLISEYFGTGAFISSCGYAMFLTQNHGYVWGYSLLNLVSMFSIVCALKGIGPVRWLEARPLVWIGKISYGVYVYHIPLLLLGEFLLERLGVGIRGFVRPAFFFGWLLTVTMVSDASFRWVETPFLKLKNYWQSPGAQKAQRG
jgi:peptidoglycan/LPS O-acetylase OafA/YrhL